MQITFGKKDLYENWSMTVDLAYLCALEGKKVEVETAYQSGIYQKTLEYPTPQVRKLFKLMLESMGDSELDEVQVFLTANTRKWHKVFHEMREKAGEK